MRQGWLAHGWWGLIRFGFRLLYNEFAWSYDLVSSLVSLGQWRQWQRASIPYLVATPDHLILELAHGTGTLLIDLTRMGMRVIGLDLSPFMGRIAGRKARHAGLVLRLVRASAMQLPFPDTSFDSVVSTFPTEFIVHPQTLAEIHRVLKPGGRWVCVPNSVLTIRGPVSRFLEWLYQITGQRGPWPIDPCQAAGKAGFEAELIIEELPGSRVWIVVAFKPA